MFKGLTATSLTILLATVFAVAHDVPLHVMGTVTGVDASSVTIRTIGIDAQPVSVALEEATRYMKDGKAVTKADLKAGQRVTIYGRTDEHTNANRAVEVTLGWD